ncbi:MAG TPA: hypothetical protein VGM25_11240 [Caulobacteraceae bacterium]|jgi:hypothetical protein
MAATAPSLPAQTAEAGSTLRERQLAMLAELAEIAMEVARSVGRQAAENLSAGDPGAARGGGDLTLALSRAARTVRLTLMLQTRLTEGPARGREGLGAAPVCREARMARAQGHIERLVRDEHGGDAETVERLMAEGAERLGEEDHFDLLPMGQIVALICNDLQLAPDRVERALSLFDADDERLPPPNRGPGPRWDVQWLGDPPRPRRHPQPPDEAERGTGPPRAPAAAPA